ncbi:division/outer membrane stress-associated lipid-binding lipoprotein [Pseudidiomarina insulisalsae]|uniref:Osmotically-inducible protein OsmY n=1 Tax=Pseudidiomarina insulisalsae TaxID=575789 RepID=A0A432YNJ0_9GAMM|nr:division/outer membrane stress-associated lipid-binding lipoprotein [Pseudidiomarina insulisalsae]RUO62468.1 osmotically-inducible protein OsmY [Pseudidiomarina insulisalsae]
MKQRIRFAAAALTAVLTLTGCTAALVGATAVGISSATDSRTVGTQVDDQAIEIKVIAQLKREERLEDSRVQVVSFNRSVLLLGQVPSHGRAELAARIAREVEGVQRVHNELRVAPVISLKTISNDSWITSKIKAKYVTDENVDASKIKVVTENSEVFLMGLIDRQMAREAIEIARNTNGVARVIDAFET